ncbi:diguanylate cyclase domain-containing protein [Bacterioplanoides sp.]|uniref:sensor domain-containing diguanylate cyclase n=1 Tax=Bacterioplanoides sp. TaxID=2066072 RepID=UPI003B5A6A14
MMEAQFQHSLDCLGALLDHVPDTLCVINPQGEIVYVNQPWVSFAANNGAASRANYWIGKNYLDNSKAAAEQGDGFAHVALSGILEVVSGSKECFSFEYPCHSDDERRWFKMYVRGFEVAGLRYFVISHTNITERRSTEEALLAQARMDGLTNIANRRYLEQFLLMEWRRCARLKLPVSILLIDIDYFKQYNDAYGHLAGDSCLKDVARCLQKLARRPGDLCARYGGEEFILVLGNSDYEHAEIMAERVLRAITELNLRHNKSDVADHVTVSVGLATCLPETTDEKEQLLSCADQMLYGAKAAGRNRFVGQDISC